MKRILITGDSGFIGKNLKKHIPSYISKFKKNQYSSYGSSGTSGSSGSSGFHIFGLNSDYFKHGPYWKNILNEFLINSEPDVIFHLGACTNTLETDVNYMMDRNFESTKVLTDYCKFNNIPLIYSSSASSYGSGRGYPTNLYGWSKYTSEQYVVNNDGIALRYFNVYGPHEEHKGNMASIVYQMYMKNIKNETIKLFPMLPKRDFVFVNDVVSANIHALINYDKLKGKFYDVGVGESRLFEDIMEILDIKFNYEKPNKIPKGYQFYTCADPYKFMNGWTPKYRLEDGIKIYKTYLDENYSNR